MTDPEFPITLAALNPDLEYLDAFEIDQDGRGENVWELVTPSGEFLAALTPGAVQLFMRREWLPTLILHTCAEWYANHETT